MVESHLTEDEVLKQAAELNLQVVQTYPSSINLNFCNMHTQVSKTFGIAVSLNF